jgi:cytochrome c oxidase assembly factor CtaG
MRHEDERKQQAPPLKIFPRAKPGVDWRRIFDSAFCMEISMTSFRTRAPISRAMPAATSIAAAALWSSAALASQGPGGGMGTASSLTQTVMAVLVYVMSAIIVGAGLIGAVRRRQRAR